jgi:hypothetical protein
MPDKTCQVNKIPAILPYPQAYVKLFGVGYVIRCCVKTDIIL